MWAKHARMNPIAQWLEEAVIGLNLCPFAKPVWSSGLVRIEESSADTFDSAVGDALAAAIALLEASPSEIATTLVGFTGALSDFGEFLDAADAVCETLSQAGADGTLQVATFHPDYQFEGTEPDEAGNYTNRSPVPVLHFIREDDVTRAIEEHPDAEGVPARNVARLEALGIDAIRELWSKWQLG